MTLKYRNITLIGTSHIARQSISEVREEMAEKPDIVAIELDNGRLMALTSKKTPTIRARDIFRIGIVGFAFAVLGSWAQKKLGSTVGVSPGAEMLTAFRLAKKNKAGIVLIDQDIAITLARFSRAITWKEKLRFPYDVLKAVFFRKKELKRLGIEDIDLSKVPEKKIIKILVDELKKKYPNVYRVLVWERNIFMADRLYALTAQNPEKSILAVVGAGHEEELLELVKQKEQHQDIVYEFRVGK